MTVEQERIINYIAAECYNIEREFERLQITRFAEDNSFGDSWHFKTSNSNYIGRLLDFIKKKRLPRDISIIDAGCGVSAPLISLFLLGYENIFGIDLFEPYIMVLRKKLRLLNQNYSKIFKQDITTYDYSEHNVIYCYMPISDSKKCEQFYKTATETMSVGAYIMDFHGPIGIALGGLSYMKEQGYESRIYKKIR